MTERFNLLSQQLLQKDFSDCSVEELQQLSQQYPFFAPAQFMLLKKLQEENNPGYSQQFQKASLYHNNILAFDLLINDQEYVTAFPSEFTSHPVEMPENEAISFSHFSEEIAENTDVENIPVIQTAGFDIMEASEEENPDDFEDVEQVPPQDTEQVSEPELTIKGSFTAKDSKATLSFEPYHTIDYFASVGIKLSKDEVAKDSFGRQLKSFTEWLKTMKRLPAAEQLKKLDPHAEEKVENIAAHSLDNSEILTEAMAEVWVKQGKLEKAIEVYNKLSLLNPSKRTYFAAKLENLKKAI